MHNKYILFILCILNYVCYSYLCMYYAYRNMHTINTMHYTISI